MHVWVNVWGKVALRRFVTMAFAPLLFGCIDDFDNPKGYGPSDGSSGTYGERGLTCQELCEESAECQGFDGDCRGRCAEIAEVSQSAGCSRYLDLAFDCLAGVGSVCAREDVCVTELNRFSACISSYCKEHACSL